MKAQVSRLKLALGLGSLFSIYGIASLAVMFGGAGLGVGLSYRIIILGIILLTLPFALVGNYFVSRKKVKEDKKKTDAKESGGSADSPSKAERTSKSKGNYPEIDKGAEEVLEFLKGSNLGSTGKEMVYSLPWYLVAGTPRSGKSALVLGSGLNFQNLPSQRSSEQNFILPTKQVDWRVTSDAVFIDTSGRLQTENGAGDEWSSVIETVKKYRPKRPLDGFLLAVNTERLLNADDRELEEQAKIIRARLDETTKIIKTKIPVYIVFTHADAIEGFRDSFSTSKKEGENLVWGTTIPLEKSENAQALFDSEYELLQDSIMKRRLIRLSAPFSPARQLRILNFPLHFGSARRKLGTFVTTLFRPNPFSESPFLRGFYFTAVPVNRDQNARKPTANTGQTVGATYFTKKFFKDVVLRDKDLVKTFLEQRQRPPILGWLVTIAGTLLTLLLLILAGVSLINNKALLDDASAKGDAVLTIVKADTNKDPLKKPADQTRREIESIENLRKVLVDLDEYEREGAPLYMRFGLYSGNRLYKEKLLNIYYNAVEQRFKQPTLKKLESELNTFTSSADIGGSANLTEQQEDELGKKYDLLKVYLMWSDEFKDRAEPTSFSDTLEEIWFSESNLAPELKDTAKAQLDFYFKQVDREQEYTGDNSRFPRIPLNKNLVDKARVKLRAFPAYLRYLKRVTTEVSKEVDPVTVDTILESRGQDTLDGTHTISGAYTIDGYRKFMKEKIANANEELSKDDWVMGEKAGDAATQATEIAKLEKKYFREYTDNWRKLVRGARVTPYDGKEENMEKTLNAFSDADSPMKILLEEIARNTDLSADDTPTGWIDWFTSFFSRKQKNDTGGNTEVEKDFRPLFEFVGSGEEETDKALPVDQYGSEMKRLSNQLVGISRREREKISREISNEKGAVFKALRTVENKISGMLDGFKTPAGQELARLMKEPISEVRVFFGADAKSQLQKTWNEQILPKAKEIESGYPFDEQGDADLTKLTAYLNPVNGTLSKFYKDNLEKYFEESNGQYVVKESSPKFSPEFITYLNNAFALRKALFGESATPNFEYDFELLRVDAAIIEVTIDGQKVSSEGTGSVKLKFPAATGTETGVVMNFSSTSGTISTSGDPGSANNPNSDVSPSKPNSPAPLSQFLQSPNDTLKYPGSWGLFKFFDAGGPSKQPSGEYLLSYKLGGKTVRATVKPTGGDLFDKNTFRAVKAPQNFMQ